MPLPDARKGIAFTEWSLSRLLAGRKTQTRRVVVPTKRHPQAHLGAIPFSFCPHGAVGDLLYVKEPCEVQFVFQEGMTAQVRYRTPDLPSGHPSPVPEVVNRFVPEEKRAGLRAEKKWSGRYMPRWCARLFIVVTDVRLEQLQRISDIDITAEGLMGERAGTNPTMGARHWSSQRIAFQEGWDEINGHRRGARWADNPWVWALTFSVDRQHSTLTPMTGERHHARAT